MSVRKTNQTLIIGFGNECRGDDCIGPLVARQIEALQLPNVRAIVVHQLTPELAQVISEVDQVFFVDACCGDQSIPVTIASLESDGSALMDTHHVDPRAILALSRMLYGRAPRAWMVAVQGERFEPGEPLSQSADRYARVAIETLTAVLN